jgi:hypothetical protein
MSRLFQPFPAKPAFGTLQKNTYSSDYTKKIKLKNIVAYSIKNKTKRNIPQEEFLYSKNCELKYNILFNKSYLDKTNLIAGQYSKEDLEGVTTISSSNETSEPYIETNIVLTDNIPFYINYTIDPTGVLFGNTQCGLNNYVNFMKINIPKINSSSSLKTCKPLQKTQINNISNIRPKTIIIVKENTS